MQIQTSHIVTCGLNFIVKISHFLFSLLHTIPSLAQFADLKPCLDGKTFRFLRRIEETLPNGIPQLCGPPDSSRVPAAARVRPCELPAWTGGQARARMPGTHGQFRGHEEEDEVADIWAR